MLELWSVNEDAKGIAPKFLESWPGTRDEEFGLACQSAAWEHGKGEYRLCCPGQQWSVSVLEDHTFIIARELWEEVKDATVGREPLHERWTSPLPN